MFSLRSRLRGGGRGIRTSGTGLNGARADVCVSYRTESSTRRQSAGGVAALWLTSAVSNPIGKGEWLAILWLKVVLYDASQAPNWFTHDCVPAAQSESEKYLRRLCSSKGEGLGFSEILANHSRHHIEQGRSITDARLKQLSCACARS